MIAGAGMAAASSGNVCSIICPAGYWCTSFRKESGGMDAVFSIVQMPRFPVATVAIDGGKNAAILAAKILATSDEELLNKLKAYTAEQKEAVKAKQQSLILVGYEAYLASNK